MIIDSNLIKLKINVEDKKEIIKLLSDALAERGIVKDSFYQAVIAREEINPTGLKGTCINFALPHTDAKHVNETAIAIATLNNEVEFHSMEDPDDKFNVSLIVMLAIKDPAKHIQVLQKLLELMQDKEKVEKIRNSSNPKEIEDILKDQIELKDQIA